MTKKDDRNKTLAILIPVIIAFFTLVGVVVQTDWFATWITPPTPTLVPTAMEMATIIPSSEPIFTSTVKPTEIVPLTVVEVTSTPIPPPLLEIFPQAEDGEDFVFVNNPAVFISDFVDEDCVHEGIYGLKLAYDINNSGSAGWGVHWQNSLRGYVDLTKYAELHFWVKGNTGKEKFQIGIKDNLKHEYKTESSNLIVLSGNWQLIRISLKRFTGVNLAFVENINIGFNENHTGGVLCIDDISLEKSM